ncbi:MAG: phosphoglycolate phosphatase [Gammaproteobacteria bacterium]|nr:phosphoglycolate phosphatase [Gammaproteobacteria bacterium]
MRGVFFDLDGTLLDTAPDLAFALNTLLVEQGETALPFDTIRPHVSHGAGALLRLGFGLDPEAGRGLELRGRLLEIYAANIARETRPFPGIIELLDALEQRALPWGVVTNKPAFLSEPLMEQLDLGTRAACIVSGDTLPQRKPHPAPLLHAAALAGLAADDCIYVGDAERDVAAGRDAGMHTIAVRYGYTQADGDPDSWGASRVIDRPGEVLDSLPTR